MHRLIVTALVFAAGATAGAVLDRWLGTPEPATATPEPVPVAASTPPPASATAPTGLPLVLVATTATPDGRAQAWLRYGTEPTAHAYDEGATLPDGGHVDAIRSGEVQLTDAGGHTRIERAPAGTPEHPAPVAAQATTSGPAHAGSLRNPWGPPPRTTRAPLAGPDPSTRHWRSDGDPGQDAAPEEPPDPAPGDSDHP